MESHLVTDYRYGDASPSHTHSYLWDKVVELLGQCSAPPSSVFEIGCGNGATANMLAQKGYEVVGVDTSEDGITMANKEYPELNLFRGSAYDALADKYGTFPAVISLEVIEHCYYPRKFANTLYELLEEGGTAIVSTPYHGYFKNLALAVSGKLDNHFTALWDGGHIKFWSMHTLGVLLKEAGFSEVNFVRVGRFPALAKSMIAVARK